MATIVPGVSIGIVFHNEGERILRCLSSLEAAYSEYLKRSDLPVEFLFVDNQSKLHCRKIVEKFCLENELPFQVFLSDTNNMGKARNRILSAAKYAHLIFLDADCVPEKNWITKYVEISTNLKNEKWAAIGGENKPPKSHNIFYRCQNLLKKNPLLFLKSAQMLAAKNIQEVHHVPTCNVLYRTEALKAVGGFNENFVRVGEDLQISARLLQAGNKIYFAEGVAVEHFDKTDLKSWLKKVFRYGTVQPRVLMDFPCHTNPLRWMPVVLVFGTLALIIWAPEFFIKSAVTAMILLPALTAILKKEFKIIFPWIVFLNGTVICYSLGYIVGLYKIAWQSSTQKNANLASELE